MVESLVVYISLMLVMFVCGIVSYRREYYQRLRIAAAKKLGYLEDGSEYRVKVTQNYLTPEIMIMIISFSFIFGFRWGVGVDYFHYVSDYLKPDGREYEAIFDFIATLFASWDLHYCFFFLVWATIQIILLAYAFRNQRFIFPYVAYFLIFGSFYLSMMNIVRQQVTACMFLAAVEFIDRKQPLKFYLMVFVAFFIHKSAVLLIPMYPLLRYKSDWFPKIKWQFVLFCIAVFLSMRYDLVTKMIEVPFNIAGKALGFSNYAFAVLNNAVLNDRTQFGNNTGFGLYAQLFRYLPILFYSRKLKEYYNSSFFNMMYTMWFVSIISDFVFGASIVLTRPFVFFINLRFVMLAYFAHYCFAGKNKLRKLIIWGIILLHVLLFLNILSNGKVNTTAFTFVWQHL